MMDTIDIEDFANQVKADLVSFFTNLIYTSLITAMPWINFPVLNVIVRNLIEYVVTFLATTGGLTAFVINTKVFTTDQAKDYVTAVDRLFNLPEHVTDDEWDKAEREANHAFANLINYRK